MHLLFPGVFAWNLTQQSSPRAWAQMPSIRSSSGSTQSLPITLSLAFHRCHHHLRYVVHILCFFLVGFKLLFISHFRAQAVPDIQIVIKISFYTIRAGKSYIQPFVFITFWAYVQDMLMASSTLYKRVPWILLKCIPSLLFFSEPFSGPQSVISSQY